MSRPGNWNILGMNLPDYNITERFLGDAWGNKSNPNNYIGPETIQNVAPVKAYGGEIQGPPNPTHSALLNTQTQPTPTQPTSGGGGGGGGSSNVPNPFDNIQPTGPSQQEIDAGFNPIFDVLNQAESNLRGQQPGLIQEAEQQAMASRGLLDNSRLSSNELLGQRETQTNQQALNQTADQRRILQEMQQANQQRFGGASSAGLAASELQGREFQRSRYGIQQNAQQALQEIGNQKLNVEREFQQGLQQLEVNKQQAINQINRTFQDRLLEINSRRADTEANKQQARLSALQDLRNQAYQINVARAQFEADLRAQAQQNSMALDQSLQQLMQFQDQGTQAADTAGAYQASAIPGVTSNTAKASTNPYVGMIGSIPGSSEKDPRFANFQPGMSQ